MCLFVNRSDLVRLVCQLLGSISYRSHFIRSIYLYIFLSIPLCTKDIWRPFFLCASVFFYFRSTHKWNAHSECANGYNEFRCLWWIQQFIALIGELYDKYDRSSNMNAHIFFEMKCKQIAYDLVEQAIFFCWISYERGEKMSKIFYCIRAD